ncbi:single-stranded DNA-binding protein [Clostridium botulinum]|uniref:Single-stranded DNA-binding protein n=1 Tax=Clostridium botulinum (strain Eklund 17B / Type B) TaxID=935198 RepID=B2TRG6_CLOBB|nr:MULTISPECIES: single-stranded DNA-binding protein [Clostridium]ACD24576.1 single-strand binding protein [Clostridium botulinum B str. Eklund 17B (NRP)]AIY79254.1 single-stranded DNA-binding family protein [Clostridium botulinum 202F]KAI3344534.1 single-stranded DNA-binding protein [Clostridium botulinum]KFX57436.1 single-stranded DNA-binding protein [Clostridium botulinum]KFX59381.1 single-stranded DNA-binding protein [Clostridium botulinum]
MNKVVLIGRLTKDPELRFTPGAGTAVTTLTLAVDKYNSKSGQKEADFVPVVVWGKQAESTANYMSKGSQMAISGRIQTRNYEAKDGTKRYVTEVVATEVQFLSKSNASGNVGTNYGNNTEYSSSNNPFDGMNFEEDITPVDDGDMPF